MTAGYSQEAFADACGFARSYMSRIERGVANVSLDAVEILAAGLSVEVDKLFRDEPAADGVVLVPYASDGTCFNPSLKRPTTGKFAVGEKGAGNTKYLSDFEDALAYLKAMETAKWWRPNEAGSWGLVSAVKWAALPDEAP